MGPAAGPPTPPLPWRLIGLICKTVDAPSQDLLRRTEQPRYPNAERKLARDPFMQVTWGLLGVAVLVQLALLLWLDVTS